jgi:hypothetical protein
LQYENSKVYDTEDCITGPIVTGKMNRYRALLLNKHTITDNTSDITDNNCDSKCDNTSNNDSTCDKTLDIDALSDVTESDVDIIDDDNENFTWDSLGLKNINDIKEQEIMEHNKNNPHIYDDSKMHIIDEITDMTAKNDDIYALFDKIEQFYPPKSESNINMLINECKKNGVKFNDVEYGTWNSICTDIIKLNKNSYKYFDVIKQSVIKMLKCNI